MIPLHIAPKNGHLEVTKLILGKVQKKKLIKSLPIVHFLQQCEVEFYQIDFSQN